jgi:flagellar hook-associated protein 1 FlgK
MLHSLNVAQSGLVASRTNVENVMNNIANENTEGYKKRVVDVKESDHSDARLTGRGVDTIQTDRITNIYMYDNLMDERSKNAEYNELSTMLADVESLFFETEDSGFSTDLDNYFQAIEDLRSNPYNEIYRTNLINQGNILVDNLQTIYTEIEDREVISSNFLDDQVTSLFHILQGVYRFVLLHFYHYFLKNNMMHQ